MKNLNTKSFIGGLLVGSMAVLGIFTVSKIGLAQNNACNAVAKQAVSTQSPEKDKTDKPKLYTNAVKNTEKTVKLKSLAYDGNLESSDLQNETDKKALDIMQKTGNWSYVEPLFPSMTSEGVQAVVNLYIQKTGNYKKAEAALPYMNKTASSENASSETISQTDYDTLATETIEKTNDIHNILIYIPHMSTDKVDEIVKNYIEKTDDFNISYSIRQYISTKTIDELVQNYVDKTGDYGTVAAMLQFMSKDASGNIAKKYISEDESQKYRKFFLPYLQE